VYILYPPVTLIVGLPVVEYAAAYESGYLIITIPDPPLPPYPLEYADPPPPPPVLGEPGLPVFP
jgi:hypothetical protein